MKLLYSFLLSVLLLSIVSAQISVNPSTISLNAKPGESIISFVNITTDGNYTVYLNYSTNSSITMNCSSPIIVEGTKQVELNFTFAKDIPLGVHTVKVNAITDIYVDTPQVVVNEVHGGGGMAYVMPNGSIVYKKPSNISQSNPVISGGGEYISPSNESEKTTEQEKKVMSVKAKIIITSFLIVAFILLAVWSYLLLTRKDGEEKTS